MADRPWVTPKEVKEYSEIPAVKKRTAARLKVDIARAEQYIITYTNNDFSDYKEIPEAVKTAVLILAEAYAHNAYVAARDVKSETFDDYSYTSETSQISIDVLDLAALLDGFVKVIDRSWVRINDPSLKVLDDGAAQLTISWRSRKPYSDTINRPAKMTQYELTVHMQSGRTVSEAYAEALEKYALPLNSPGSQPG